MDKSTSFIKEYGEDLYNRIVDNLYGFRSDDDISLYDTSGKKGTDSYTGMIYVSMGRGISLEVKFSDNADLGFLISDFTLLDQ